MSKKVKNLITNELTAKFKELDGVAVISPSGIDGIKNNLFAGGFATRACG